MAPFPRNRSSRQLIVMYRSGHMRAAGPLLLLLLVLPLLTLVMAMTMMAMLLVVWLLLPRLCWPQWRDSGRRWSRPNSSPLVEPVKSQAAGKTKERLLLLVRMLVTSLTVPGGVRRGW